MRLPLLQSAIAAAALAAGCVHVRSSSMPTETSAAITARDLEKRLTAFAHDSMMGREAGTLWNAKAADYVAAEFARYGLRPAGENGTWFQTVPNIRARDTTHRAPARNVVGIFPGSDPVLRNEYVAITAHNDHIGYARSPI